nr:carboxypeptidase regulatory-like domain-containing protein [Bacteroidota bacterium]
MKSAKLFLSAWMIVSVFLFSSSIKAQSEMGELQGTVLNSVTNEPVPFASVALFSQGNVVMGASTDFNGKYKLKPLKVGNYELRVSNIGYGAYKLEDLKIGSNKITLCNVKLVEGTDLPPIVVIWERPIIEPGVTSTLTTLDAAQLRHSAVTNIRDLASTATGTFQKKEGGSINIRGSRDNATMYIIDGVRCDANISIPRSAIAEMNILTGGIPAMFGDATGGIVIITTKSYIGSNN